LEREPAKIFRDWVLRQRPEGLGPLYRLRATFSNIASSTETRAESNRRSVIGTICVFCLLLAVAMSAQWASNCYQAELSGYPDEAAHYVTTLMVRQYALDGFPEAPVPYAAEYYLHYPKVAIGHWPPLLYAVFAFALIAGHSIAALLVLEAILAALVGVVLWRALPQSVPASLALLAAILWLLLPVTQAAYTEVMAECLLTLTSLLSTLAFASYLTTGRTAQLALYSFWAFMAIMTKGSGFSLVLVPYLALALRRQWGSFRDRRLHVAAGVCLALSLPWSIYSARMVRQGMALSGPSIAVILKQAGDAFVQYVPLTGILLALLSTVGVCSVLIRGNVSPLWSALLALLLATYALHIVAPTGIERRHVLMAVPAILAFAAEGMARIAQFRVWRTAPAAVALGVGVLYGTTELRLERKIETNYRQTVRQWIAPRLDEPAVILIACQDEGILISELAQIQPKPQAYILRGTKMLADVDWAGFDYKPRFQTSEEARHYLDEIPVNFIALDVFPKENPPWHRAAVEELTTLHPKEWRLVVEKPVRSTSGQNGVFRLFERTTPALTNPPRIDVDLLRMLGRKIRNW
jgi:Dolichyl-phosphate-mannose-protein mannosyltransferase